MATILSLPNEILHQILAYICDDRRIRNNLIRFTEDPDRRDRCRVFYRVGQIQILRIVCRRFRETVARLDCWCDPQFQFLDLGLAPERGHFYKDDHRLSLVLESLLLDRNLVENLSSRKTEWKFESHDVIKTVMENIPRFRQNARAFDLVLWDDLNPFGRGSRVAFFDTVQMLSVCSELTTLRLCWAVHLEMISSWFPHLEELDFVNFWEASGSLETMSRLKTLHIKFCKEQSCLSEKAYLLPLASASTLTSLHLEFKSPSPYSSTHYLTPFTNLKALRIDPMCETLYDFVIRSSLPLEIFGTKIQWPLPSVKLDSLFQSQSFRCLKQFELGIDFKWSFFDEERYRTIFDVFTSCLTSVEEVKLVTSLIKQCCAYFSRMRNLKRLNWHECNRMCLAFGCKSRDTGRREIEEALNHAFETFPEKPVIAVCLR
jgi:hypothetical protein